MLLGLPLWTLPWSGVSLAILPHATTASSTLQDFRDPSVMTLAALRKLLRQETFSLVSLVPAISAATHAKPPTVAPMPKTTNLEEAAPTPGLPIVS